MLVAVSTNVAIIAGFVASSIVSVVLLAAYHSKPSDGIWRIAYGIGIIVRPSRVTAPSPRLTRLPQLPLSIFVFRMRMVDSSLYRKHAVKGPRFPYKLALMRYWKPLLG